MTVSTENTGRHQLLLVEDEEPIRFSLNRFFSNKGYTVTEAASPAEAFDSFRSTRPDCVILDYHFPDAEGLSLLRTLRGLDATVPIVMLTGHGTIDLAVSAIKEGAEQFFTKPVELPALLLVVERLIESRRAQRSKVAGKSREARDSVDPFVGDSAAIRELAARARRVAVSQSPVLILGETGTGKGVLARWLHQNGPRADEPFVDLNCAGLSRDFLETELFGHEKGAFTGAIANKQGLLEIAHRGSVFLDEIGDLPAEVQPKLLKVLEERRFRRLGDIRDRMVDVRLIAATHRDLEGLIADGRFRADLLYRVNTLPLRVPPLRERGDDVVALARGLLTRIAGEVGRPGLSISSGTVVAIRSHRWPGNVRELRNCLERAALFAESSTLRAEDLFPPRDVPGPPPVSVSRTLVEAEREHIRAVLVQAGGDAVAAARVLGLTKSAFYRRLAKHGILPPTQRS